MDQIRLNYTQYLLNTYTPMNFIVDHAKGSRLFNQDGTELIDFTAGIAVNALGHAHPLLQQALLNQATKIWHAGNIMINQPMVDLAAALIHASCFHKSFICNSGTEAVEASLKLARRYALLHHGSNKHKIVSFKNSFHGRTLFAVAAGGQPKYSADYSPLPSGILHGVFNDIASATQLIDQYTAAVIVEPIQAEGGVIPADPHFLVALRQLCDQYQAMLIFDEVQTGLGRTGKLFAYQYYDVEPDSIALAKALGGGFPIGAMLVKQKFSDGFTIGSHGSTYGGNPLACAVALQVLKLINTPSFLTEVTHRAQQFKHLLIELNDELSIFSEIRGIGLLIGAQLNTPLRGLAHHIIQLAQQQGVAILNATADVIRFTPALNIPETEMIAGISRFKRALQHLK